jgi:ATP-dependent DNA ligase
MVYFPSRGSEPVQRVATASRCEPLFYAFDLLWLNGEDLRHLPLVRRKERLRRLIDRNKCASLMFAQHIEGKGTALFNQILKWDMEGIICKRKTSEYSTTAGWLKVMNPGYTQHEGRQDMFTKFLERSTHAVQHR